MPTCMEKQLNFENRLTSNPLSLKLQRAKPATTSWQLAVGSKCSWQQ